MNEGAREARAEILLFSMRTRSCPRVASCGSKKPSRFIRGGGCFL